MTPSEVLDSRYQNRVSDPDRKTIGVYTGVWDYDCVESQIRYNLEKLDRTVARYAARIGREVYARRVAIWKERAWEEAENDVVLGCWRTKVMFKMRDPWVETEDSVSFGLDDFASIVEYTQKLANEEGPVYGEAPEPRR